VGSGTADVVRREFGREDRAVGEAAEPETVGCRFSDLESVGPIAMEMAAHLDRNTDGKVRY
jgi:hypothetical protein